MKLALILTTLMADGGGAPPVAGRPSTYTGWVGKFEIQSSVDRAETRVGEDVEFRISIRGRGKEGDPPTLASNPKFTLFDVVGPDPDPHVKESATGKQWTYVFTLTPKTTDVKSIPAILWTYYDETLRQFQTMTSPAIPIAVSEGELVKGEDVERPRSSGEERWAYAWLAFGGMVGLLLLVWLVRRIHWLPTPPANAVQSAGSAGGPSVSTEHLIVDYLTRQESATREEWDDAMRQFRAILAARFGITASTATSRDLLDKAGATLSASSFASLRSLLDDLDRSMYGPAQEAAHLRALHGRMRIWLRENATDLGG